MKTYNLYFKNKKQFQREVNKLNLIGKNILIQLFTSEIKKNNIIKIRDFIVKLIPQCKLIGTTTDGEIKNSNVSVGKTVVSISVFENTQLKIVSNKFNKKRCKDCFTFGKNLASKLKKTPQVAIFFTDGLNINGENFLNGLHETFKSTIFAGGLAGTSGSFKTTYIFDNKKIYTKGAVGVGLYNKDLQIYNNFKFNWTAIGKEMTITKADGNQVFTIDNKTAYETYKYYLGEDIAKMLPKVGIEFPLIIEKDEKIARAVLSVESNGSLRFAGNLNKGDKVRFGYGDRHHIIKNSYSIPKEFIQSNIESIFIYSCMARRRFMPKTINKEIKPFSDIATVSGFFTHGEFFTNKGVKFLNQSMTLLGLSETKKRVKNTINLPQVTDSFNNSDFSNSQKALAHLVNTTSTELLHLNQTLEEKVTEKIKEIRNKDKVLIENSKLASMGEMIGNIAHQWRQPLNALGALNMKTEMLLRNDKQLRFEEYKPISEKIISQLNFMSTTIDDFRNFFIPTKKRIFNINESIYDVLNLLNEAYLHKKIQINYKGEDIYILGKKSELIQVILNLINNAKDALEEKNIEGLIYITLQANSSNITITVMDNGGGIEESIQDKIFEPYFSTKLKKQGTGIGLYMSKKIITEHFNGNITVRNTTLNNQKGCCFTIVLPKKNTKGYNGD